MSYIRHRQPSPDRTDRSSYVGPISASMGSLSLSDTDPYYRGSSRDSYRPRTTADRPNDSSPRVYYDSKRIPRTTGDAVTDVHSLPAKKHNAAGQKTSPKAAYTIRTRSRTSSDSGRRPQFSVSGSPGRQSSLLSGHGKSRTPQGHYYADDDTSRLVIPSSSRHRRVYPTTYPDSKSRSKGYVIAGGDTRKKAAPTTSANHPIDIDSYDSYSYTNPREQFYRDSDHIQDYRRESARQSDHAGGAGFYSPQPSRRESRQPGPPPSTRGFERISMDGERRSLVHNGYESNGEAERRRSKAGPVAIHQPGRGDYKDTQDPRDYRIRHDEDGTVVVEGNSYYSSKGPTRYPYRPTDDRREPDVIPPETYASNYPSGPQLDYDREAGPDRTVREQKSWERTRESQRKSKPVHSDSEDETSEDDTHHRHRKSDRPRRYSDESNDDHRRDHHLQGPTDGKDKRAAVSSTAELIEDPQIKTEVVEPRSPPKGILKAPTQKFPEDPNAVREGVAPLKDATKKGIPIGARWTKVDRRLVSPSVLEGQERYEERPDYVIVLRVLSKEEIHDFALKTAEVRGKPWSHIYSQQRNLMNCADICEQQPDTDLVVDATGEITMIQIAKTRGSRWPSSPLLSQDTIPQDLELELELHRFHFNAF